MAESATSRIAAKLAERKSNEASPAPVLDDEAVEADEAVEETTEPAKPLTMREKQAAKKAAATKPKTTKASVKTYDDLVDVAEADAAMDDGEDEDDEDEAEEPVVEAPAPKAKAAKAAPTKGKKPASPAQIAAREKFAAASRARAAAARGEPVEEAETKPIQTPDEVRASQNAKRRAAKAEIAATPEPPKRAKTSNSKVVTPPSKAAAARAAKAVKARDDALPKLVVSKTKAPTRQVKPSDAKGAKTPAKAKSSGKPSGKAEGETKAAVLALVAKGKTRRQIMDELGLSYASVFYHTKGVDGGVSAARGKIFVKSPLDEDGNKLGRGKAEEVSRSEHMRRQYLSGMKVGDIARDNGVLYQIAYTAIRTLLTEGDED